MLGALFAAAIVATALAARGRRLVERFASVLAVGSLALLAATLFGEGLLGVHRWVGLGPVHFHASSIACPVLLAAAAVLLPRAHGLWAAVVVAAAQGIHALQPDVGQLIPASLAVAARGVQVAPTWTSERRRDGAIARATGAAFVAYVAGTILVSMPGNFPVPVLGFGISPVLGVGICVGLSLALQDRTTPR